ncbi:MAG: hypothetical protein KGI38_01525 [Thaumarchaeota archaeon]|nr:hypothetical protein [Nitrososphaerota archaeon]
MIDGLRRRFSKSVEDAWNADLDLQPEVEATTELPTDTTVLLAAQSFAPESRSNDVDMKDYYKSLVQTAIQQGGKYRGRQMSVPWLRMILAGLESKPIPAEMMWQGEEPAEPGESNLPRTPSYEDVFIPK